MANGKTIVYLTDDETAFLNVDVGVFAKHPLEPLAAALGDDVSLHYVDRVGVVCSSYTLLSTVRRMPIQLFADLQR